MYYHDGALYFPESYSRLLEHTAELPVTPRDLQGHSSLKTVHQPDTAYLLSRTALRSPYKSLLWGQPDEGRGAPARGATKGAKTPKESNEDMQGPASTPVNWRPEQEQEHSKKRVKHVFLKADPDGRMEKAGVAPAERERERAVGGSHDSLFSDKRTMPQATADYLNRLGRLRDQLIHQESENLSRSLDRFREQTYSRSQVQTGVIQRQGSFAVHNAIDGPRKHKKAQSDKLQRVDRARKGRPPPKLDPLLGEKLIDIPEAAVATAAATARTEAGEGPRPLHEVQPLLSASYDDVRELITDQASRIDFRHLQQTLRPQQSIPSIHRKSLKVTEPMMLYGDADSDPSPSARNDTFVRHMSIHQKDQRGLYKGNKRRELQRGDGDEVDLYPEAYRFESREGSGTEEGTGRGNYYVPSTSPVEWERGESSIRYKLPRHRDHHRPAVPTVTMRTAPTKQQWPSPRLPQHNNVSATRQNVKEYEIHAKKHVQGARSKSCMFCAQPGLTQQLDYVLFSRTGTTLNGKEPRPQERRAKTVSIHPASGGEEKDEDVITARSLRGDAAHRAPSPGPIDKVKDANQPSAPRRPAVPEADSAKKKLVVEMPNIKLRGATPQERLSPEPEDGHQASLLEESMQHKQREQEVTALKEDLKDLSREERNLRAKVLGQSENFMITPD